MSQSNSRWFLLAIISLFVAAPVSAAGIYGKAIVNQGEMLVLRGGKSLIVKADAEPVEILEEDLLRVRDNSRVTLQSKEKAEITLGSNAVFHVKPWEKKEETGFARMLFGRLRASVVGLTGGERFNLKTATATIGVKGTDYRSAIATQGETLMISEDHTPTLRGPFGTTREVAPGQMSFAAQSIEATTPVEVLPEITEQFSMENLNSPAANSARASEVPGQEAMIRAGIITQEQLNKSRAEKIGIEGDVDLGATNNIPEIDIEVNNAIDSLYRGNLRLIF
ncbi:MAG: FecR family protein [Deltaproteobacteria bacterium]|nr:FecR family protein [Deltaproteobacteria bacterium]